MACETRVHKEQSLKTLRMYTCSIPHWQNQQTSGTVAVCSPGLIFRDSFQPAIATLTPQ